jgi:hypothetical protein
MFLAGCGDPKVVIEKDWDYPNVDIIIEVRDSDGGNWFDNYYPGNMRKNNVKITYDGAVYEMLLLNTRAKERNLPDWDEDGRSPFRLNGYFDTENAPVRLLFGEFSADTKNYRGESFTIDWGNGETSTVKFDLYTTPNGKDEQPTIHSAIWVEDGLGKGTKNDGALALKIVK